MDRQTERRRRPHTYLCWYAFLFLCHHETQAKTRLSFFFSGALAWANRQDVLIEGSLPLQVMPWAVPCPSAHQSPLPRDYMCNWGRDTSAHQALAWLKVSPVPLVSFPQLSLSLLSGHSALAILLSFFPALPCRGTNTHLLGLLCIIPSWSPSSNSSSPADRTPCCLRKNYSIPTLSFLLHRLTTQEKIQDRGASLLAQAVKNPPATQETWVWSLSREDPQRRKWQPTAVFLPGESHGQRNVVGCSPWGCKESDITEQLSKHSSRQKRLLSPALQLYSLCLTVFFFKTQEFHGISSSLKM